VDERESYRTVYAGRLEFSSGEIVVHLRYRIPIRFVIGCRGIAKKRRGKDVLQLPAGECENRKRQPAGCLV